MFGWTIAELDEQPSDRIMEFLTIIRIEGSFESIEQQKMQSELDNNGKH